MAALVETAGLQSEGAAVLRVFRVIRPLRTVRSDPVEVSKFGQISTIKREMFFFPLWWRKAQGNL